MVVDAAVAAKILGEKSRLSRREQIGGERGRTSQASNLYSSVREVSLAERVLFSPSLSLCLVIDEREEKWYSKRPRL